MAVSKLWSVKNNMGSAVTYIENPDKTFDRTENADEGLEGTFSFVTEPERTLNGRLMAGVNCNPLSAEEEFEEVKKKFDNEDGVQAYHGYIAFAPSDNLTPVDALTIGKRIVEQMWAERFQVLIAVHTNTAHLHIHFLVNSVSFIDGKKARDDEKNYIKLRAVTDKVCREYGLSVVEHKSQGEDIPDSQVVQDVLEAVFDATDPDMTRKMLEQKGYRIVRNNVLKTPSGRIFKVKQIDKNLSIPKHKQVKPEGQAERTKEVGNDKENFVSETREEVFLKDYGELRRSDG